MITYKQLTLAEIFEDCQNKFDNDKYQFLSLLDETINLDEIVPMFDHLVDLTEPICQSLDPALASMTIFDTSGIEAQAHGFFLIISICHNTCR